jgi:hypothetical protein
MEGAQHTPLRKDYWVYGRDRIRVFRSIMNGIPSTDMIPWSQVCSNEQGYALTDFILENQKDTPIELRPIPSQIETQDYWVKVETLAREGFIPPLGQLN